VAHNGEKNPTKSTPKIATFPGRPFRIVAGPGVSEVNLRIPVELPASRANRAFLDYWQKARRCAEGKALIQRDTPPVNIIGGYQFWNAPAINWACPTVTRKRRPAKPAIGDDPFVIPEFLKRFTTENS
jgi:hypothetical protein